MKTLFKQGILLAASIVCLQSIFGQKPAKNNKTSSSYSSSNSYMNVRTNGNAENGEALINYSDGAKRYSLKMVDDKVTELYIDDKKIPGDSIYLYNSVIDKIKDQLKKDRAQAAEDRKQADKDRAQAVLDRAQAEKDRQQANKDREQAMRDREQAMKDRQLGDAGRKKGDSDKEQANKDRQQAEKDRQQAAKDREQANKDRQQAELDRKQAILDRKQAEEDRALVKSAIGQMVKDGIVNDEKELTFVLSEDEFTVNGKKQPEQLHNSYKAKYIKKAGTRMSYNTRSNGTFMNIDRIKKE